MKYVAFVRGINVGGNSIIKMAPLRMCFENAGFSGVATYIQSGNVIFESNEKNAAKLTTTIEDALSRSFDFRPALVVRSRAQLAQVVADAPRDWSSRTDLRCNVAFLRPPLTARQALKTVPVKEGVDNVCSGTGVLYMSTLLRDLKKSALSRLVGTKVYQEMTIRNYATCRKVLALMT